MKYQTKHRANGIVISVAGAALLSLFLTNNQAKADTQTGTQQSNVTNVQQNNEPNNQQNDQVVTNQDNESKPNNQSQWSNPADYKNDVPIQILGINDVHGNIDTTGRTWVGKRSYQNAGDASRLAGYLNNAEDSFKKANPNGTTIRVEAGDMVGASPASSSLLQDEPTMKALKGMNITIGTLGNHEFDEGLGEFKRIVDGTAPKKGQFNQEEENYPHENSGVQIVISNLVNKSDGQVPYGWKPYLVKEVDDGDKKVKVGFIGVVTTDLPKLTFAKNLKDYKVLDEAESIAKYDRILQAQGVHAIVVLAHTGIETYKGKTSGDSVKILQKLDQIDPDNSVDLYVAAHSHQYANATVGKTKVVQAACFSKAYDDVIGYIDPKTQDFVPGSMVSHVYPVMSAKQDPAVKADPKVEAIIKDAEQRTSKITNSVIGKAKGTKNISKDLNKDQENAIGDLVVDAQMAEAKRQGITADVAITNGGGVRSDLKVEKDGSIKWQSAQAVQPFSNQIQVFEMTGQQIYNLLNSQYAASNESRYYLLSGMHYAYTTQDNKDYPKKVAVVYDANNHPIDPKKTYRVITSNYLVDSTKEFKGAKKVADVGVDTDLFVDYLEHQTADGKLITAPTLNRKEYVDPTKAASLIAAAEKELTAKDSSTPNTDNPSSSTVIETPSETTNTTETSNNTSVVDNSIEIPLTHNAFVYDQNGRLALNLGQHILLRKGEIIKALNQGKKVAINGKDFYQIGDNAFVKVANTIVRNKKFVLKHNAYVYTKKGAAIKRGRKHLVLRKGKSVNPLNAGKMVKIKGKLFYQISKNRFVKVANF